MTQPGDEVAAHDTPCEPDQWEEFDENPTEDQ